METETLDFQQQVLDRSQETPVVVDFWAEWCGPCKILGPVIEKMATEANGRWELVKVNTEIHQDLAQQYKIQSIPAVKMFYQGKVLAEFNGALPEYQIQRWLDQHLPDPRINHLEALFQQWVETRDPSLFTELEEFVATHPDLLEGRLRLAAIILLSDPAAAKELLTGIHQGHKLYEEAQDIRALADLMDSKGEGHPKVQELMRLAKSSWEERDLEATLDHLIQAIVLDKSYADELPRRAVVAIFHQLGEQHPVTKAYRPRFSMALY